MLLNPILPLVAGGDDIWRGVKAFLVPPPMVCPYDISFRPSQNFQNSRNCLNETAMFYHMAGHRMNSTGAPRNPLGGLRPSSVVLLLGVMVEAACVAVGVWITTWYRLNTALFDASFTYMSLDFIFYLGLLIVVPVALSYIDGTNRFRNI